MTGLDFRAWRAAREWSQDMAASALGISRRTIVVLEGYGASEIPKLYALAVRGVNATGSDLPTKKKNSGPRAKTGNAVEAAVRRAIGE